MDLVKAQILLEKINRLYKSMSADAGHVAGIEKDLMRSYIRQFYETFLEDDLSTKDKKPPPVRDESRESRPYSPPEEPKRRKEPVFEVVEPRQPEYEPPKKEEKPPPPKVVKPEEEVPVKMSRPETKLPGKDFELLFEQEKAKELADKLGEAPIKDLTKAFSINDRIFNTNELFGGESDSFYHTIQLLDSMNSFEQAKSYLANNVAHKYNWTSKGKKKIAKNFIKIIRRRFRG